MSFVNATIAGVPRVKRAKKIKAKPLEPTIKRDPNLKKKKQAKAELDAMDDTINGWRKK